MAIEAYSNVLLVSRSEASDANWLTAQNVEALICTDGQNWPHANSIATISFDMGEAAPPSWILDAIATFLQTISTGHKIAIADEQGGFGNAAFLQIALEAKKQTITFDAALTEFNSKMPNVDIIGDTPRKGEAVFASAAKTKGDAIFRG